MSEFASARTELKEKAAFSKKEADGLRAAMEDIQNARQQLENESAAHMDQLRMQVCGRWCVCV